MDISLASTSPAVLTVDYEEDAELVDAVVEVMVDVSASSRHEVIDIAEHPSFITENLEDDKNEPLFSTSVNSSGNLLYYNISNRISLFRFKFLSKLLTSVSIPKKIDTQLRGTWYCLKSYYAPGKY